MNLNRRYKLTIEDETVLENKLKISRRLSTYLLWGFSLIILTFIAAMLVLAFTPLKRTLPGYLKETERAATEEQHLRLDSILNVYNIHKAYVESIFQALDPTLPEGSINEEKKYITKLSSDSLLPTSQEEREFTELLREKEKFNIASTKVSDAENILFESPHPAAVITEATKDSYTAEIVLPYKANVSAMAEGKVISLASSLKYPGSYEIIIQHPKGFLSKTGSIGMPMVSPGDYVSPGEIIGSTVTASGRNIDLIIVELWHNGDRLIPSRFLYDKPEPTLLKVNPVVAKNNIRQQ